MTTTSTDTIHTDITDLIRKALPRWATVAQLGILTDRFCDRYAWGWICGDGSAGGAHSQRGAAKAASRAAGRAARRCSGPDSWICIVDLDMAVGGSGDEPEFTAEDCRRHGAELAPSDYDEDEGDVYHYGARID
jgi:hypothetical protein